MESAQINIVIFMVVINIAAKSQECMWNIYIYNIGIEMTICENGTILAITCTLYIQDVNWTFCERSIKSCVQGVNLWY